MGKLFKGDRKNGSQNLGLNYCPVKFIYIFIFIYLNV